MYTSDIFQNIAPVTHAFFGRKGGVSEGAFDSLNLALRKGDSLENVIQNRERAMARLGYTHKDLNCVTQVHGNKVHILKDPHGFLAPDQPSIEADATVTTRPNTVMGILTADCVPVLFSDESGSVVGAAHAGWRGALAGILENTVQTMKDLGAKDIHAAIGPCIHQENYEVGPEVHTEFLEKSPEFSTFFTPSPNPEKFMFDLPGFVESLLKTSGVTHIENTNLDTYTNPDDFFSCRRATHKAEPSFGCQLSAICIQG